MRSTVSVTLGLCSVTADTHVAATLCELKIATLEEHRKGVKAKYQAALEEYVFTFMGKPLEKLQVLDGDFDYSARAYHAGVLRRRAEANGARCGARGDRLPEAVQ